MGAVTAKSRAGKISESTPGPEPEAPKQVVLGTLWEATVKSQDCPLLWSQ